MFCLTRLQRQARELSQAAQDNQVGVVSNVVGGPTQLQGAQAAQRGQPREKDGAACVGRRQPDASKRRMHRQAGLGTVHLQGQGEGRMLDTRTCVARGGFTF